MRLPHRDPIQLGPTPYEAFQEKEGIPSVLGFFIEDLMDVEVKPWTRMGALGCYLNMGEQQEHDAYICEIPAGKQTEPQLTLQMEAANQRKSVVTQSDRTSHTHGFAVLLFLSAPSAYSMVHILVAVARPLWNRP